MNDVTQYHYGIYFTHRIEFVPRCIGLYGAERHILHVRPT